MKVDCALLCDAATVREGLLHILGGGITRMARPQYPHPLNVQLALRIVIHPTESGSNHSAQVILQDEDGTRIAGVNFDFAVDLQSTSGLMAGEQISLPLAVPVQQLPLPKAGGYSFEVLIDGNHQVSVPFQAVQGTALPPGGPQ